jgi:hypothetical protein
MAKAKEIKPLFPLKHEFVDALDRYTQAALMLRQAVRFALRTATLDPVIKKELQAVAEAFDIASRGGPED